MMSYSVAADTPTMVQVPLGPGAEGRISGSFVAALAFIEPYSTPTGIDHFDHRATVRIDFDLSISDD